MLKKNKFTLILTSIMILLPVLIGLLLWDKLPDQIPSHWDINGNVDSWSSKPFAVFGFPGILLAIHWACILVSSADPSRKNYHPKMIQLVLWICPVISMLLNALVYTQALEYHLAVETVIPLLVGVMFIIVGNLLPKCRQSYTMGIKLPWTLANEENWNKTHRLAGKLWVIGGVIIMSTAFLGEFWVMMGVMLVMVAVPTVYSYCLYRKQTAQEE